VDAHAGAVQAQVVDQEGKPVQGFTFADGEPITRDALAATLAWRKPLAHLTGKPVRLELTLRKARMFGIDVQR
jgi:hypothetical protein